MVWFLSGFLPDDLLLVRSSQGTSLETSKIGSSWEQKLPVDKRSVSSKYSTGGAKSLR